MRGPKGYPPLKVAASRDGERFCVVWFSNRVKVFETRSGEEIATIEPQTGAWSVDRLVWELDGDVLHMGWDTSGDLSRITVETWSIGERP